MNSIKMTNKHTYKYTYIQTNKQTNRYFLYCPVFFICLKYNFLLPTQDLEAGRSLIYIHWWIWRDNSVIRYKLFTDSGNLIVFPISIHRFTYI